MRTKMFIESEGARTGVAKVAIVLTDGQSSNMAKTVYEAFRAKMENIQIFAIGIGSNINSRELRIMASSPPEEFFFEVENYAALDALKQTLAVRTCKVTAPPTTTTTTTTTTTPSTTTSLLDAARERCRGKALDIVFALDSSDNIIDEDLEQQAMFFRSLVDQFDVTSGNVRFGSFMYSDQIQKMFDLNEYENAETIKDALMKLGTTAGSSRVSHALTHVLTKSFRRSITRPNAAQVGIIITGSPSKHMEQSKKVAMKAKRSGLQFIAIGVGEKVDSEELRVISASSDGSHYFQLHSFHQLMKILPELVHQVCQVPEPDIPMSDQTCGDRQSADMMFLLDSVNAGKKNTRKAFNFLKALVDKLAIDKERIQVGLMSPECQEEKSGFKLNEFTNKESAVSAFGEVKGTDFHSILHQMRRRAFSPQEGGRKDAKKIAILVVDGELEEPLETLVEAQRARTHGVEVYVVQVGKGQTQDELLMMCDEPTQQHFFKVDNYDELMELSDKLIQALCDEL
ncbi:hypothetical protein ACJMK2_012763 [Sinanodonta woodiana]